MAGLSCARHLHRAGVGFALLEAADGVGGRVRTDALGGFQLDRGFQIFLTSYPEARAALDYAALDLQPFYAGAQTVVVESRAAIGVAWRRVLLPWVILLALYCACGHASAWIFQAVSV